MTMTSEDPPLASSTTPSRRVVKAKAPPPKQEVVTTATAVDDNLEEGRVTYPLASPSVEREIERERSEKWRKERLDATVSRQKQGRVKDMQHARRSTSSGGTSPKLVFQQQPAKVPPEFSVEPQCPEHKRSGDDTAEEEPLVKRRRSMDSDGSEEEKADRAAQKATRMIIVSAAMVAAVAIGVAFLRRRGG